MEKLQEIIEVLKNNKGVTEIELKRGTISKEVDGWKDVTPADQVFVSFTYDKNSKISLSERHAEKD